MEGKQNQLFFVYILLLLYGNSYISPVSVQ